MTLYEAEGKYVRIETDDGQVFEGRAYDYTSALDNEPDPESISIGLFELYSTEIRNIEELNDSDIKELRKLPEPWRVIAHG